MQKNKHFNNGKHKRHGKIKNIHSENHGNLNSVYSAKF